MRIASLCPSATETAFALGLGDAVVGVSHACDFPPEARSRPPLTSSLVERTEDAGHIHERVRANQERWGTLYDVDEKRLAALQPDLVLTQRVCRVCATPADAVLELVRLHLPHTRGLAFTANRLEDFFESTQALADLAGVPDRGRALVEDLRASLERLARRVAGRRPVRSFLLEWTRPVRNAGHWLPELVQLAGGEEALGNWDGRTAVSWEDVVRYAPEVLVVSPCGFTPEQAQAEIPHLERLPGWFELPAVRSGRVWIGDGRILTRYAPRLVDVAWSFGHLCHPEAVPPPETPLFTRPASAGNSSTASVDTPRPP